jgi:hypothetical protein
LPEEVSQLRKTKNFPNGPHLSEPIEEEENLPQWSAFDEDNRLHN